MGKPALGLTSIALTAVMAASLTACDSDAATAPPPTSSAATTSAAPTPTASAAPTPPVMPNSAKRHTIAGAKAFVLFYVGQIDYAESTLDTSTLSSVSLKSCVGCQGGITGLDKIRQQGGRIEGSHVHAAAVSPNAMTTNGSISVFFTSVNAEETVIRPGQAPLIHPAAKHSMVMTLVWKGGQWLAAQYEAWK